MDDQRLSSAEKVEKWLEHVATSGEMADISEPPTQLTMATSDSGMVSAPVWVAERHQDDWTATVGSQKAFIEDCCTDGAAMLSKMNPETFQMHVKTRVVCIKTQHLSNVHTAVQCSMWIAPEKVGDKINRVYEEHDPDAGEKVLFLFSINRQRSFCALAEMNGPWVKGEIQLPGWQEAAGGFNVVGSIPVTFTHVKNVSNETFEHVHHENPNQPITNMWNGMHFQLESGREVVRRFHEKPHFTNVLCRDKRKSYSPFNPVTSAKDIDPTVSKKNGTSTSRFGSRFGGMRTSHTMANWRYGQQQTTPTNGQKRIEDRSSGNGKTSTPTRPKFMQRKNVPSPLQLRTPHGAPPQASPSPRPGEVVKCIVDANGALIPMGPFQDSPTVPKTVQRANDGGGHDLGGPTQSSPYHQDQLHRPINATPTRSARDNDSMSQPRWLYKPHGQILSTSGCGLPSPSGLSASAAQRLSDEEYSLPSGAGINGWPVAEEAARTGAITKLNPVRQPTVDANYLVPHNIPPSGVSADFLATWTKQSENSSRSIQVFAHERNEQLLSSSSIRRQGYNSGDDSASSALPSEYKDWASTPAIEKLRITQTSPGEGVDPFVAGSVPNNVSPMTKAFEASINKELRNVRQGSRATPMPSKEREKPVTRDSVVDYDTTVSAMRVNGRPSHAVEQGGDMEGGVHLFSKLQSSTTMRGKSDFVGPDELAPEEKGHTRGLSSLSGVGQLPSDILPAMMSAGQYAPAEEHAHPTTVRKEAAEGSAAATKQTSEEASAHAGTGSQGSSKRSDLIHFTP